MKYEYKVCDAPIAITEDPSEDSRIWTSSRWEDHLNRLGEDGWDFFRYEYGKWFFKRVIQ